MSLHETLSRSAAVRGEHPAVVEATGASLSYRGLEQLSDRLRDRLVHLGIQRGDRVGIYLHKSADGVASIFGILKAGAAYVPVDPTAPASRNGYIHANCAVKVVIVEECFAATHRDELAKLGAAPRMIVLPSVGGGAALRDALDRLNTHDPAPTAPSTRSAPDDLAYILYTSGSTGKPKGVMLTHRNACSFVDWCTDAFDPKPEDRFSSHAPFHFDLSILDLYVPIKHGATICLIPEDVGKEPAGLASLISRQRITVWYSAPSILALLAQFGKLGTHDYSALRTVLFAGEVFPIVHLRSTKKQWPHPRYFNLYGPTETNVCSAYEIPPTIPEDRSDPYPIGKVCSNLRGIVVDAEGRQVASRQEGELCISGPNVMTGYWGMAEQTARAFLPDDGTATPWYRTGDLVVEEPDGNLRYLGRRDRMIKKRGYRVELGEIESCLYQHESIREAAVVALPDESLGMKVTAHLSTRDNGKLSTIQLKRFISERLPLYMVPDTFRFHDSLPKTSTDKIDYQTLQSAQ